jgi:hypothetical protein
MPVLKIAASCWLRAAEAENNPAPISPARIAAAIVGISQPHQPVERS